MDTLEALRSGALAGCRELRLSLDLETLPGEILDLAETLEILDLSGNRLTDLPDGFSRLRKLRIAFFSKNRFEALPEVLGECPALEMVGFKSCRIRSVAREALPERLRWFILTDNLLEEVPEALGERPRLQKLMLAGNRLRRLPENLVDCRNLELLRIAANRLETFPGWLAELPRLAWLAWSGNPFGNGARRTGDDATAIPFDTLSLHELLGQGASGNVWRASWNSDDKIRHAAVKVFKGMVTSDGDPEDEMRATLAAGAHPHLAGARGRLVGHPEGLPGLVLDLIPPHYRPLGLPPSYESCTRDVFPENASLSPEVVRSIARGIASLAAHLHGRGILHGDLYAHNILVDPDHHALLGDFGAASLLDGFAPPVRERLERLEVRAFGCLLDDLLGLVPSRRDSEGPLDGLHGWRDACLVESVAERPSFAEIAVGI